MLKENNLSCVSLFFQNKNHIAGSDDLRMRQNKLTPDF